MTFHRPARRGETRSFLMGLSRGIAVAQGFTDSQEAAILGALSRLGFHEAWRDTVMELTRGFVEYFLPEDQVGAWPVDPVRSLVFDNLFDDHAVDEHTKSMVLCLIQDEDEWIWAFADLYQNIDLTDIESDHRRSVAWRCDQTSGLLGLLSSREFLDLVRDWPGNWGWDGPT